jgi:hypothetical protein
MPEPIHPFGSCTLVGCGGTGATLAPQLARLLSYHPNGLPSLDLVDADTIEEHNLERQPFGQKTVGLSKARETACSVHSGLHDDFLVMHHNAYLDRPLALKFLRAEPNPMIILAVDNDATRKASLEACDMIDGDFFWISPGNADASAGSGTIRGTIAWWGRQEGLTVGVDPRTCFTNIATPGDDIPRVGTCTEQAPSHPQLIAANFLAAAWTLAVVDAALNGRLNDTTGCLFFDGNGLRASS